MRTVSRFQKNAKTEAVPIKGIADRLVSTDPTKLPYWLRFLTGEIQNRRLGSPPLQRDRTTAATNLRWATASRAEFAASSPLTNNRSSCRNYTPYRYSSGNSCRSSYMRVGLPQTQSRKSPPQETKREFWYSFSYGLSLLMQPRLAPAKR